MFFRLRWSYEPIPDYELAEYKYGNFTHPEAHPRHVLPGCRTMQNDYMVDRIAQKELLVHGHQELPACRTSQ